jgi:hypothetical protein
MHCDAAEERSRQIGFLGHVKQLMLGLTDVFIASFQRAPETPASAREMQPRVFRAGD